MKRKEQQKIRILHIEDDREFAEATAFLLGDDYEVEIMGSTNGAIGKVTEYEPDVILLDLELPGKLGQGREEEGLSLLRILKGKAFRDLKDIPVIVVTDHSGKEVRDECLNLRADGFFAKPIEVEEVIRSIHESIKKSRITSANS